MKDLMIIGDILFAIDSPLPIPWKLEDREFQYNNESYKKYINVILKFVAELPQLIVHDEYKHQGIRFGRDSDKNIVREFHAPYIEGNPLYAVSVFSGSTVTIYFIDDLKIWNNPNIRIWNMIPMENLLLDVDGFVLHCSYLMYNGKAILFSAPSGTGKTTQAKLWERLSSAQIINGDKAIIQEENDGWYAKGFPFHGSSSECLNQKYPIEAIVVVRQNSIDFIEDLKPLQKFQYVYSETTVNVWNPKFVSKTVDLVNNLIHNINVVCQHCTMNDTAFYTLYHHLKEKKNGII